MRTVVVLQGISGSGKTRYAHQVLEEEGGGDGTSVIVSADDFFGRDEMYKFVPTLLPAAHAQCLRWYVEALRQKTALVVVDNTNTTIAEAAPYMALGDAYGYDTTLVRLPCNTTTAFSRTVHTVPYEKIVQQQRALLDFHYPDYWQWHVKCG